MSTAIDRALQLLGIRNFLLGIHDAAFPSLATEDLGRGSPYTDGAAVFLQFARSLGFNGVQLGPQGITTPANASPYDGSFFSRNPLSLAPLPLTNSACVLLGPEKLAGFMSRRPGDTKRVDDRFVRWAQGLIAEEICCRYRQEIQSASSPACTALQQTFSTYRQKNSSWLGRDALYQVLRQKYGGNTWKNWGKSEEARLDQHLFAPKEGCRTQTRLRLQALYRQYGEQIEDYCLIQFLLAEQHRRLREHCHHLGLQLFGDCQIGISRRDAWYAQSFLLPGYVMGAPPSRTNPLGQPWNYPVLDPRHYGTTGRSGRFERGAALRFVQQRLEKMAEEFDGLRLDHPHGLICPWVYKEDQDDPFYAVQNGARLFASPNLPDHPALAGFAIVRPDQLNTRLPRYADDWVTSLAPEQLNRYGQLFAVIMDTVSRRWHGAGEVVCEILSTQPYPIKRVLQVYGLGRQRVTQKADLANDGDVCRSENAQPEDWLMLGNHDTPPIWLVAEKWAKEGSIRRQAEHLATRLAIPEGARGGWIDHHALDTAALVQAKFAELFLGPARNIMVFFVDLLGSKETYNRPGTVSSDNWTQRVPPDYRSWYSDKAAANHALNIPRALAMALRAKEYSGDSSSEEHRRLIRLLEGGKPACSSDYGVG
ncbi:4-alpha-glucanotransferase [Desulfopila sp. IMCC35006]|uniref:4-alpha-glucanotransferase n=1 Tax=Desulfopila sp. IMCC35006 TaxID=2569542 RepID=UPI00197A7B01|nr:4-alpha-glucanotransferase [Desulfopila sp. IMCC35006]